MKRTVKILVGILFLVAPIAGQQRQIDREFLEAVQQKDLKQIELLLQKGANVNAREPINGYFALQYAINWPDVNLVKLLLDKGAKVNLADKSGNTALTDVADRAGPENTAIVKLLIARGANVHANHDAAILGAARSADTEVVKLLLDKGANVNAKNEDDGNTVLLKAADGASVENLQLIISAGGDLKAVNDDGETALMRASRLDHRIRPQERLPMIELLISKGADVNARDKSGRTPLSFAVAQQMTEAGGYITHPEVVELLLAHGADVNAVDGRGVSVLALAKSSHANEKIIAMLVAAGAR